MQIPDILKQYLQKKEMHNYKPENQRKKNRTEKKERILYKLLPTTDNSRIILRLIKTQNTNKQWVHKKEVSTRALLCKIIWLKFIHW